MGSSSGEPQPGAHWPNSSPDAELGASFRLPTQEGPTNTTQPGPKKANSRGAGGYPRRRAVRACQVCRARRTKCDNKRPSCSFCERVGAKCITNPIDHSSFDPASLAILERLDRLETLLNRPKSDDGSRDGPVEKTSPASNPGSISTLAPTPALSRITIESILTWSPFRGRFENRTNLKALLENSIYCGPEILTSNEPHVQKLNLDLSACIRLLHNFLERVHIANPILNTTTVLDYLHQVCLRGLRWDAPSCLVLLICALGSISEAFQDAHGNSSMVARLSTSFRVAQEYFEAAQMRLGVLQHSQGVLEAQCFFYSGVYLMTIFQPMRAWRSFVQAAAISQSFDFSWTPWERDPNIDDSLRNERASVESTFWASLKSELELRMELGLPSFSLQDVTYPNFFPSPPTEQLDDNGSRVWYFYLAEISVRRLSLRILRHFFENQTDGAYPHIHQMAESSIEFENQAAKWVASLPPILSLDTPEADDDVLKFVLRGHLLDCYESIYFPYMLEAINHQRRDMGVIDEFARKGLQMSAERIHKNRAGFKHRHHGVWLMLRSCTRSALVLLAARGCPETEDLLPPGWTEAVTSAIEMLFYWQDEAGDAGDRQQILMELMNEVGGSM